MLKNYFITAWRKLNRQKNHALINVLGLALGMACCIFIFLIIQHELQFDRFHSKRDRIYRVITEEQINDIARATMGSPMPMAEALRNDFPQLEKVTVTFGNYGGLFTIAEAGEEVRRFRESENVAFVEPEFFEIFDFPWLAGDPRSLAEPNTVALTESTARKFFAAQPALGKTVRMDNSIDLKVMGIVKDFPRNTDFPFAVMLSWKTVTQFGFDVKPWGSLSSNVNTYVLFPPDFPPGELESKLPAFKNKYHPDAQDANKRSHRLQALREVHYDARYGNYGQRTISRTTLWGLGLIGIFLLITACINFVNMATAQALNRAKEVGVRKVLGAFRSQLVTQYLGETAIITVLAAALAVVLVELFLPVLSSVLRLELTFELSANRSLVGFILVLIAVVSLLAGLYPALVLSQFMPASALKSKSVSSGGLSLRRGLVVLQFIISQMLIIGTIVVSSQMDYLYSKEMGFNKEALVVVPLPQNDPATLRSLRAQLLQNSNIANVTFGYSSAASGNVWDTNVRHKLHGPEEPFATDLKFADANYISTYGLKLIAGRNYVDSDTISEFVVNETFARMLGMSPHELVGKMFRLGRRPDMPIVGVVQDFHARPLQEEIRPCLLAPRIASYYEAGVRINTHNAKEALAHLEKSWTTAYPEFVYSLEFLDERLASFYQEEEKMSQLFRVFAAIAIFVGCLGLTGLVSFLAAQRTKEIGVRKVLGASVIDILGIFSKEFSLLITLAFVIAAPVAYMAMQDWLTNFAYRINIGVGVFLLAIISTMLLAAVTVGYRALKAALANPVEALRYE